MKPLDQSTKDTPDTQLVALVKNGDQAAFSQLVDRYMVPVFRLSYSLLQDISKAEDMTQETFMVLWQQPESWEPTGQLKSWLFRIARNKSIDEIRGRKHHQDIEATHLPDQGVSPAENVFDGQMTAIINRHLQDLPMRQREAVTLVHFLECTNIEAAETMEISVDALESLLSRGRRKLKEGLKGYRDQYFRGEAS